MIDLVRPRYRDMQSTGSVDQIYPGHSNPLKIIFRYILGSFRYDQILFAYDLYCKTTQNFLFFTINFITIADIFIVIITVIFNFGICDNPLKTSIKILKYITLIRLILGIIKYFLLIIYITKLFKTF